MTVLAVVIVSYNTRDLLAACLDSLAPELAPDDSVIVVDNGSTDGSPALVREHYSWVHLMASGDNLGFAGGNNLALRALGFHPRGDEATRSAAVWANRRAVGAAVLPTPDFVALLNPDTRVSPGALRALRDFLATHPRVGAVGPRLAYPDGRLQHSAFTFPGLSQTMLDLFPPPGRLARLSTSRLNGRYPAARYEAGRPFAVETLLGACLMLRREAIEAVGLLDEGFFMYAEELDWCRRLTEAHWQLVVVPAAHVVHYEGQSTRQFREVMFVQLWRSRLRLFDKHHGALRAAALRRLVAVGARFQAHRGATDRRAAYRRIAAEASSPALDSPDSVAPPLSPIPMVTAVVLTRNEARHIQACLASVAWAGERLVIDTDSEDGTAQLAVAAGAQVVNRPFVNYADQRNAALSLVTTPWTLFVDADERIPAALAEEIRGVVTRQDAVAPVGYWIPRHNYIFGHLTRGGGWWPDYQLRLMRTDCARYDPQRAVHELVILDGPEGYLRQPLVHYNYADLAQFRRKQAVYTSYDAGILYAQGQRARPHNFILQPLREFRRRFISLGGYRDGRHGLHMASLMTYYEWVKYRKLRALAQRNSTPSSTS